jgi:hypothetical protein
MLNPKHVIMLINQFTNQIIITVKKIAAVEHSLHSIVIQYFILLYLYLNLFRNMDKTESFGIEINSC